MQCPACAAESPEGDLFCEACGHRLTDAPPVPAGCVCGAPKDGVDDDGFCTQCGRRVRRPASDHIEMALSNEFAAVADRGQRHERNEDRFCLFQSGERYALVVCDGVSSTHRAEIASACVSEAVVGFLARALDHGDLSEPESVMRRAIAAGVERLAVETSRDRTESSPSTTVVAALVLGTTIVVGWMGDSRAYWIDGAGAHRLSRDHSWMNEVVAEGRMTVEEARLSPKAHAITRWVGADAESTLEGEVVQHRVSGPGTLLLCTDGLWNYVPEDEAMHELYVRMGAADALSESRALVQYANEQGGQDNITVALLRIHPNGSNHSPAATSAR